MKRYLFPFLFYCFSYSAFAQFTVVTFNIRYDNAADKENAWSKRKAAVADSLNKLSPDILCLQEVLKKQYKYLSKSLKHYKGYGVGRNNGKKKGEYCPIFYNKDKFILVDKGTFWLSENPKKPGRGWDAASNRIVTWVKLKELSNSKILFVFNTHFDNQGSKAQMESARLIVSKASEIAGDSSRLIVGDLNITDHELPYKYIVSEKYQDAGKKAPELPTYTYTGFKLNLAVAKRIDYIFYKESLRLLSCKTLEWCNVNGNFLSDHLPVYARFE